MSGPSYWLTTDRLALRRFTPADLDWLAELYSDGDVTRYLGGVKSRSEAQQFLDARILQYYDEHPGLGIWVTVERATGRCLGFHLLNHIRGESIIQIGFTLVKSASTIGGVRTRYRMKQADTALNAYRALRPTLNGLPAIAARSDDQVMILTPIADHPADSLGYRVKGAYADLPQIAEYTVCYMNRPSDRCGATPPAVDVRVTQYPTAEWALYAQKGTRAVGGYGGGLGREKVVVKFGQRLFQPTLLTHDTGDVYG